MWPLSCLLSRPSPVHPPRLTEVLPSRRSNRHSTVAQWHSGYRTTLARPQTSDEHHLRSPSLLDLLPSSLDSAHLPHPGHLRARQGLRTPGRRRSGRPRPLSPSHVRPESSGAWLPVPGLCRTGGVYVRNARRTTFRSLMRKLCGTATVARSGAPGCTGPRRRQGAIGSFG